MGINVGEGTGVGVNVGEGNRVGVAVGEGSGVGVDIGTGVGVMVGSRVRTCVGAKVGAASTSRGVRAARVFPQPPSITATHKHRSNAVQIPVRLCFPFVCCIWLTCVRGIGLRFDGGVTVTESLFCIVWGKGCRPSIASSKGSCAWAFCMTVFPVKWRSFERNSPTDLLRDPTSLDSCQGQGTAGEAMVCARNFRRPLWIYWQDSRNWVARRVDVTLLLTSRAAGWHKL